MNIENIKYRTQGITFVALSIIVILLVILVGISFYVAKEEIEKEELEELKTNMLLIQAKAREYVEEVNFKIGVGSENEKKNRRKEARKEIYVEEEKLREAKIEELIEIGVTKEGDNEGYYFLTNATKEKWGLNKLNKEEQYLIKFDETNVVVEIYNIKGYKGKYSLTDIDQMQK